MPPQPPASLYIPPTSLDPVAFNMHQFLTKNRKVLSIAAGIAAVMIVGLLFFRGDFSSAESTAATPNTAPAVQVTSDPPSHQPTTDFTAKPSAGVPLEDSNITTNTAPTADPKESVQAALLGWQAGILANDPNQEIQSYADHIERYYLKTNVDRAFVLSDLKEQQTRGDTVLNLHMDGVTIDFETSNLARVDFTESVEFQRQGVTTTANTHTILKFINLDGSWKVNFYRQFNR